MKTMMKLFSFSLFTLLTLFTVTGCSDDDSDLTALIGESVWKGKLTSVFDGVSYEDDVRIEFYQDGTGIFCEVKTEGRYDEFTYQLSDNGIQFTTVREGAPLKGYWWLLECSDNQLSLRTHIGDEANYHLLEIERLR